MRPAVAKIISGTPNLFQPMLSRRDHFDDIVVVWGVASHNGVFPNHYANTITTAFLSEAPKEATVTQRATLVRWRGMAGLWAE